MVSPTRDTGGDRRQGTDGATLIRHFGTTDALPLWIAEPDVELAPSVTSALQARAADRWFGYETRPGSVIELFRDWTRERHAWDCAELAVMVSPSVGTSTGVLVDLLTRPGDGVIIQPPVFTDFKTIVSENGRTVVRNPLVLSGDQYKMDLDDLASKTADPGNKLLILCNPHNPVGRVWDNDELAAVAAICAEHDVFVLADEIHADLALPPHRFTPFAAATGDSGVRWAATHGPIKTFGLAGVCDTLLVTDQPQVEASFETRSSQFHLTRNNVFAIAAFEAAYRGGRTWLDDLLVLMAANVTVLASGLPDEITLVNPEGTYLAWLDLRALDIEVAELGPWLAQSAGVAVSPGHWFGREGAGFARLTIATPTETIERVVDQLRSAIRRR